MEREWKNTNGKDIFTTVDRNTGGNAALLLCDNSPEYTFCNELVMAQALKNAALDVSVPVTIVGDYDADGCCSAAELYLAMADLGRTDIDIVIPKRMSQGYGLNPEIVKGIKNGVLITVDNGIGAAPAIRDAKDRGMTVYTVDHHLPPVENGHTVLPDADLIADPNVDDALISKDGSVSAFRGWSASGLVFRLASKMGVSTKTLNKISAMAYIGTVADVMSLEKDNVRICREGSANMLSGNMTEGTAALVNLLRSDGHVSSSDIGFKIGPMLNAPGRLYDTGAMKSLITLLSGDSDRAQELAFDLNNDNDYRKREKERAVKRADEIIEREGLAGTNPIIVVDSETSEGIVGLVAGDIREKYNVTAIVLTEKGDILKGSGRAADYDHLKNMLDTVHDADPSVFIGYGGHRAAAGVTIRKDRLSDFVKLMHDAAGPALPFDPSVKYDIRITADMVPEIAKELEPFRPFGQGNPDPVFRIDNVRLMPDGNAFFRKIGEDSVRFSTQYFDAVGFSLLPRYEELLRPAVLDLIGTISYHYFGGSVTPQVEIIDMKIHEEEKNGLRSSLQGILRKNGMAV